MFNFMLIVSLSCNFRVHVWKHLNMLNRFDFFLRYYLQSVFLMVIFPASL